MHSDGKTKCKSKDGEFLCEISKYKKCEMGHEFVMFYEEKKNNLKNEKKTG